MNQRDLPFDQTVADRIQALWRAATDSAAAPRSTAQPDSITAASSTRKKSPNKIGTGNDYQRPMA